MMTRPLLVITAVYVTLIGLALLIVPAQFRTGAVPHDMSSELLAHDLAKVFLEEEPAP